MAQALPLESGMAWELCGWQLKAFQGTLFKSYPHDRGWWHYLALTESDFLIVTITQREDANCLSSEEAAESSSPKSLCTNEISEAQRLAIYGKNAPLQIQCSSH